MTSITHPHAETVMAAYRDEHDEILRDMRGIVDKYAGSRIESEPGDKLASHILTAADPTDREIIATYADSYEELMSDIRRHVGRTSITSDIDLDLGVNPRKTFLSRAVILCARGTETVPRFTRDPNMFSLAKSVIANYVTKRRLLPDDAIRRPPDTSSGTGVVDSRIRGKEPVVVIYPGTHNGPAVPATNGGAGEHAPIPVPETAPAAVVIADAAIERDAEIERDTVETTAIQEVDGTAITNPEPEQVTPALEPPSKLSRPVLDVEECTSDRPLSTIDFIEGPNNRSLALVPRRDDEITRAPNVVDLRAIDDHEDILVDERRLRRDMQTMRETLDLASYILTVMSPSKKYASVVQVERGTRQKLAYRASFRGFMFDAVLMSRQRFLREAEKAGKAMASNVFMHISPRIQSSGQAGSDIEPITFLFDEASASLPYAQIVQRLEYDPNIRLRLCRAMLSHRMFGQVENDDQVGKRAWTQVFDIVLHQNIVNMTAYLQQYAVAQHRKLETLKLAVTANNILTVPWVDPLTNKSNTRIDIFGAAGSEAIFSEYMDIRRAEGGQIKEEYEPRLLNLLPLLLADALYRACNPQSSFNTGRVGFATAVNRSLWRQIRLDRSFFYALNSGRPRSDIAEAYQKAVRAG